MIGQITGWSIVAQTEEGKDINITDVPNWLAQDIDNWLTENIE